MKNVVQRILTGAIYIFFIILSLKLHPLILGLLTVVFNIFALYEFQRMANSLGAKNSNLWIAFNIFFFVISVFVISLDFHPTYLLIPIIALPVAYMVLALFHKNGNPIHNTAYALLGSIYISVPLIFLNLVQQISLKYNVSFALAMFVMIWTNDTFAYLTGIAFGKHKMFVQISPKKSWEGFAGGLITVMIASLLFYYFFPDPGLVNWLLFGLITTIAAVCGDFFESLIKRTASIKDSGSILPGHGGMLDRIDSMLFACPVIFIYLLLILKI